MNFSINPQDFISSIEIVLLLTPPLWIEIPARLAKEESVPDCGLFFDDSTGTKTANDLNVLGICKE